MIYFLIGGGAGVLAGMFGIGGGILIVPAIVLLTGMNLKEAYGTSLAALLLPVGIFGCIIYYKEKLLDFRAAGAVAFGIVCTVGIGAYIANILDLKILKICYTIFLFYTSFKFITPKKLFKRHFAKDRNSTTAKEYSKELAIPEVVKPMYMKCIAVGLIAGFMSGFFGVGGGAVIVPLLTLWLKIPAKEAIATSLGILLPPIGLPGVLVYHSAGNLNFGVATCIAIGLLIGTLFGARLTIKLPVKLIKTSFGVLLLVTGIKFALNI